MHFGLEYVHFCPMSNKPSAHIYLPLLLAAVCTLGMIIGMRFERSLVNDGYLKSAPRAGHAAIYEASEHINAKFYGDLDERSYTDAVLSEMIDQLDPYSHYFEKNDNQFYDRYMEGLYEGVGLEFVQLRDSAFVYKVIPGSPAANSGIQRGDLVLSLDSVDIVGSRVKLDSLMRAGKKKIGDPIFLETFNFEMDRISRQELVIENVTLPLIENYIIKHDNGSSYTSFIGIKRFYSNVFRDFMEVLEEHGKTQGTVTRLILDLRDNPGGVVEETIKILNQFITEKQRLILSTQSKVNNAKEYHSNGRSFLKVERIVIICNKLSASASEILAGVLQDYDKAVIIGQNSFGKGLIQQNYDLSNEGSINLSIGEYILPSGRHIYAQVESDSIFKSLENQRELKSIKGIPVDVTLDNCSWTRTQDQRIKNLIVENGLWDRVSVAGANELVASLVSEDFFKEDCKESAKSQAIWEILKNSIDYGEVVTEKEVDRTVKRAFDIIQSDEYNQILGYD